MRQSWDDAIARFGEMNAPDELRGQVPQLLQGLRDRWEPLVDVTTHMFDLEFNAKPSSTTRVRVRRDEPTNAESSFRVSLVEVRPRASLEARGGVMVIAGEHCRPENAAPVVESFLHQLVAAPAVASQIGPGRAGPFRPRREVLRSLLEIGLIVVAILLGSGVTQVDSPVWATILAILTAVALVAGIGLRIHRLWTEE